MPGLLRGMARTAVIAGTASAVSGRVQRRQAERYAERDGEIYAAQDAAYVQQMQAAAAPPPPPAAAAPDLMAQLKQLGDLHASGVLTDDEFAAQKAKLLGT